jgi:hypothetical protein
MVRKFIFDKKNFLFYIMSSNFFILYHYSDTIVHDTNNNIIFIRESTLFLNGTKSISFKDTKKKLYVENLS